MNKRHILKILIYAFLKKIFKTKKMNERLKIFKNRRRTKKQISVWNDSKKVRCRMISTKLRLACIFEAKNDIVIFDVGNSNIIFDPKDMSFDNLLKV